MSDEKEQFEALGHGQRLGDAPVSAEYHRKMVAICSGLDDIFNGPEPGKPKQTGFVLMVFKYGDARGERCNYMSNGANREEVGRLMREMADHFEGKGE